MTTKCAVVVTTAPDIVAGLPGLCERLTAGLEGQKPDLVLAFYTPHHSGDVPEIREQLLELLEPRVLLGSPAAGIIGENVEIEQQAGLCLWAAAWPDSLLHPFQLESEVVDDEVSITGWPEPDEVPMGGGLLLLADPYTTHAEALLAGLGEYYPGIPVVGGMASGTQGPGDTQFITSDGIRDSGCVGVVIGGSVRLDPIVSQGCRPVGHHFVVTKADRNVIYTLGGKPALAQLRSIVDGVDEAEKTLIQQALHVGRVVDERKSSFEHGDFLVRNVVGIDPKGDAIAISDYVRAGQTIQFMVRDARTASEDLEQLLASASRQGPALGAMIFSCNGRGSSFFKVPHHDLRKVHGGVGDVPTAGFFCSGEIGPVGGEPFLHGFTASIALFREQALEPGA